MRSIVFVLALAGASCGGAPAAVDQTAPHAAPTWSHSGATGPEHWGELATEYATCKVGQHQSPINLEPETAVRRDTKEFVLSYQAAPVTVVNNGHTIQATPAAGTEGTLSFRGEPFKLAQFHFHHPSEHTVNGESFPLEVHFVNANAAGNLTVVGVLIKQGAENKALAGLFSKLPSEESAAAVSAHVNLGELLPPDQKAFVYSGSLTTPPCTEQVNWIVMKSPIEMSASQIAAFAKLFPNNYRPVQKLNDRTVSAQ